MLILLLALAGTAGATLRGVAESSDQQVLSQGDGIFAAAQVSRAPAAAAAKVVPEPNFLCNMCSSALKLWIYSEKESDLQAGCDGFIKGYVSKKGPIAALEKSIAESTCKKVFQGRVGSLQSLRKAGCTSVEFEMKGNKQVKKRVLDRPCTYTRPFCMTIDVRGVEARVHSSDGYYCSENEWFKSSNPKAFQASFPKPTPMPGAATPTPAAAAANTTVPAAAATSAASPAPAAPAPAAAAAAKPSVVTPPKPKFAETDMEEMEENEESILE